MEKHDFALFPSNCRLIHYGTTDVKQCQCEKCNYLINVFSESSLLPKIYWLFI